MLVDRIVLLICVFSFTAVAAFGDLKTKKVPNALVVPAFCAALVYHLIHGALQAGLPGAGSAVLFSLMGFSIGFGVLFVLWLIGGGGGGDVKFMGALGAWLGPTMTLQVLFVSAALALVGALGVLILQSFRLGPFGTKRRYFRPADGQPMHTGSEANTKSDPRRPARRRLMPFAVPAAMATWSVLIVTEFILQK